MHSLGIRSGLVLAVLATSQVSAYALGCKDIKGAKVDPDLAVMSTVYGRLLPDSKKLNVVQQQSDKITIERLIATKIVTTDGSASALIRLSKSDESTVSAQIDGRKINQTIGSKIAGLGYQQYTDKITSALERIGQPLNAFVAPKLGSSAALVNLSATNAKILVGRPVVHIVGTPNTAKKEFIRYTCSQDAEFAGNPDILRSIVVMHGVLKATSITQTTTIDRVLDIQVSDYVTQKTISRAEFQTLLAQLPGINDSKPSARISSKDDTETTDTVGALAAKPHNSPSKQPPAPSLTITSNIIDFFSLNKPGSWALILVTLLLCFIGFLLMRNPSNRQKTSPANTPFLAEEDNKYQLSSAHSDKRIETLKEATKTSEDLQKHLQLTLEQANTETTNNAEVKQQLEALQILLDKTKTEARELSEQNHDIKTRLDEAETESRNLNARVLELQTAAALTQRKLATSQTLSEELEGTNQTLMGVNEGYREKITLVEAEQTALMLKLNLREGVISQTENLNKEMLGLNEEVSHTLVSEKASRETLEKEFERLTSDYNTLWTQSSSRLAKLRHEETGNQSKIRSLNDALLSLGAELEALRKDRKELNREFIILGNENARLDKDYRSNINQLETIIKSLNLKLSTYEQLFKEYNITVPSMSRLPVTERDLPKFELGLNEVYEKGDDEADTLDNVIRLTDNRSKNNS